MKRITSFFLTFLMIISLVLLDTNYIDAAASRAVYNLESKTVKAGESFTVNVELQTNPGFTYMSLVNNVSCFAPFIIESIDLPDFGIPGKVGTGNETIEWQNGYSEKTGVLAVFHLKAPNDLATGSYTVTLAPNQVKNDSTSYRKTVNAGTITVTEGDTPVNKYTITYNANGGTSAPAATEVVAGNSTTITNDKPSRDGYVFLGWSTDKNATEATYIAGNSITPIANMTLYAIWRVNNFSIIYDANGGTGAPDAQIKTEGQTIYITQTVPFRTGYDFVGWGTTADATTVAYNPGDPYTADTYIRLYAIWKLKTYKINYNPNGGTGAPDAGTKQYGKAYTISTTIPTKANNDFVGWSIEKDGVVVYQGGDTYTDNANLTLYAKWATQTVKIKYNMNGGTGSIDTTKAEIGSTAKVTSIIPEREGYDFLGWSTNKDATEAEYASGAEFTVPAKVVNFYAIWKLKTYKVKFNMNGGEGSSKTLTKNHGEALVIPTAEPTWESHRFLGWSEDKNATVATYLPGASYTENKATTLYAIWIEQYSITFDANGGSGAPEGIIKEYGVNIKLPEDVPTRKGYKFLGWSADQNATEATYKPGGTFKKNKDTVLYAVWVAQYTITFNANGGNPTPAKIVKTAGVDITLPTDTLYKTGYDFLGWSESQTATKATYKPGATYSKDKKATLYAVWKKTQYKITFNANGGSGGPAAKTVEYGDSITLSFKDSEIPTRAGYICIGWATKKNATDPTYTLIFPETIKNVKASATLYAVWVENPFSDITGTKWYTRYVGYIYYRKAMTGQGDGSKFGWSNDLTRAEMVTLLWKLMGQPEADKTKKPFPDVKTYQWYTAPIAWAKNNGIVNGRANGTFAPLENITRQDFVKILYSFAQYCELDVSVDNAKKYLEKPDANKVASYARVMVNWAYTNGFIGNGSDLKPTDNITRAEAATIMSRFLVKYGV